jgi:hypothetical protein
MMPVITLKTVPTVRIDEFAEKHGFQIEIIERSKRAIEYGNYRYYAHFKGIETKDGPILCSETGNGSTPLEALKDYCRHVEGKLLVKDAAGKQRQEVRADCYFTADGIEL